MYDEFRALPDFLFGKLGTTLKIKGHPQELEKEQSEIVGTGRHVNRKEG